MTDRQTTHAHGCWSWGPKHSECAIGKLERLQAEAERLSADLMESDELREKFRHLLTRTAAALKGEPPEGVWHSWHDLPEKATQLVEALRKLEERVQRDEALLRRVLEALSRAHQTAMKQTLRARIPECGEFAGIAQDLDFILATLRERLGEDE